MCPVPGLASFLKFDQLLFGIVANRQALVWHIPHFQQKFDLYTASIQYSEGIVRLLLTWVTNLHPTLVLRSHRT